MTDMPAENGVPSRTDLDSGGQQSVPVSFVYSSISFLVILIGLQHQSSSHRRILESELKAWLDDNQLRSDQAALATVGCVSLVSCASLAGTLDTLLPDSEKTEDKRRWESAWFKLKGELVLKRFLREHDLSEYESKLFSLGAKSLESLHRFGSSNVEALQAVVSRKKGDWQKLEDALEKLQEESPAILAELFWKYVQREQKTPWTFWNVVLVSSVIAFLVGMASTVSHPSSLLEHHSAAAKLGFFTFITGKYLSPQNCRVEFNWEDPQMVGSTVSFAIRFFQRNWRAFPISNNDNLLVEITQGSHKIACSVELGGTDPSDANKARVQFSVRRSGEYSICVLVGNAHVKGSPFIKRFLPGNPEPQKTGFVHQCSTVVCTEYVPYHLFIEPRDKYSNVCSVESNFDPSDEYTVDVVEINSERPVTKCYRWECHPHLSRISLVLKFDQEGCYRALVYYRGIMLQNGDFHVIVLNKADGALVQKNVAKKSHNIWYEAKLLGKNGDVKPRKVFCYVSPKQLTIKEYVLKFIPKRLVTFRLCPSTKFQFKNTSNQFGEAILVIDDGCQSPVELLTADRNVIVATFAQFLLKNIGGSETFKDKRDFFYHEVRKMHQKHFHDQLSLKISRDKLLESSMKAIKNFGNSDWCRNFEITFVGEQGLDYGGVRREWFELLCVQLFGTETPGGKGQGLFQRFKNDKQGLVHPNPKRPSNLKLKHYEFAGKIVGKCLYESALGSTYRQLVKARLSRSFLAQLIGLRVHYKYFEQDDPDLYVSKIKYILENDVDNMDLVFSEEEYADNGQLLRVVDLIPNGSNVPVNNENKRRYLDALAQHRLANSIKEEVDHFLKGLNELIPDSLLCIFDENELELLMCGTGQYSIADFKANHAVSGANYEFRKILDWFWTAVSNFTEEEMARLLQFTTGCSQLPPGGFGELNPRFHITAAPTFGNLPTAHTCFNQLCLPDYDSYEQFERALRLSINEGSEGFGMV